MFKIQPGDVVEQPQLKRLYSVQHPMARQPKSNPELRKKKDEGWGAAFRCLQIADQRGMML